MNVLDVGTYGAKRQSWRSASPRDLLKRLIEEHPRYSESRLLERFEEMVKEDGTGEYLSAIVEYWFANNYRSLTLNAATPEQRAAARQNISDAVAVIKKKVQRKIQEKATAILLDMVMPNGKQLRACTGQECAAFSKTVSPFLARIAAAVKPMDVVGEVLSEAHVRDMYAA